MIIYIYGEDAFRSREYLRKNIDQFKKQRDPQGYNVAILDGKKAGAERILGEILSVPFLAERRMVVLENLLSSGDKELLGELISRVKEKKIPETNVVIFWQEEPMSKVKEAGELSKILEKEKFAQYFPLLSDDKLSVWIREKFKERNQKISDQAIIYLSVNSESDMWLLHSLIDQLINYKNGEEITIADIRLFLEEKVDDSIFSMVDAVVTGNKKLAFKLLEKQRNLGEDDSYLFSMIMRQFKILLEMRDLFEEEDDLTSDRAAKILSIHPYVAKKSWPLVKRFSLSRLKEIYSQLLEIDIKTKTGQGDQSQLLDFFVGRI